ncbi:Methyltransferase domain-containing protein [Palleronia salina]|uniref:Methyltransferase domain-containing protein n=1 Tax=Palleronia salina TaxID=313368 RepID=A0A1M6E8A5_9RHOB|nr:class I SAM-dependent methyltransferase [Palleronia salina]SHI81528.1 Methyltransferase domain-containing protein [Palleronia salina]
MAPTKFQAQVLSKGEERFQQYQRLHNKHFGTSASGRILDFGCGAGGFMLAAHNNGLEAWGIETDSERQRQYLNIADRNFPDLRDRFHLYDGRLMPYPSNHFDAIYSWFVFEHVTDPQCSVREIVRTLAPGGTVVLHADDVRNNWDGHAAAPWPPYLPREFAAAYLEGLGKGDQSEFITNYVVYISTPTMVDILTTFGMEIVYANAAPERPAIPAALYVTNDDEARALGRKMRDSTVQGPTENMTIVARKPLT